MLTSARKSVFLYGTVDTFSMTEGGPRLALDVCESIGACLTATFYNLENNVPPPKWGRDSAELEAFSDRREAANLANVETLRSEALRRSIGFSAVTNIVHSHGVVASLADRARLYDLIVTGVDRHGMLSDRSIAEHLLFATGRPVLVTPTHFSATFSCRRMVAAWDNSRSAARALNDALLLFPDVEEIVLLVIGGEKAIDSSLDDAEVLGALQMRNVQATIERRALGGRSIGSAIQESAIDLSADLLIMGGYGHSRLREFLLGGATASVLDQPMLPVLLSH